jgi:hypothetical protein
MRLARPLAKCGEGQRFDGTGYAKSTWAGELQLQHRIRVPNDNREYQGVDNANTRYGAITLPNIGRNFLKVNNQAK